MPGLLEISGRVAVVYVGLLILLRIAGRRELSQLSPIDLMAMLLLSETVSPAMTAGNDSLQAGLVAATTLVALSVLISWLSFRSQRVEHLIQGQALILIRDGEVDEKVKRKERISDDDLATALHEQGLTSIDQVERAFVEPGGDITVIERR